MKIEAIELFHIGLPLRTPAGLDKTLETVLVGMCSAGVVGWGEASPGNAPRVSAEWAAGAMAVLRDWLAPAVVGQGIAAGDDLAKLLDTFRGNQFAKAALDSAWWDLDARRQNRPLYEMLGGQSAAVEVGFTVDQFDSLDSLLAQIAAAFEAGFARVKFTIRPGQDIELVKSVRQHFPTQAIHVDCEGRFGLQHFDMLQQLDALSLAMIEQPLAADDLVGHAMVQEAIHTHVCLDEGIASIAQAEMAMELHSCHFVNLKPGRVGGLTPAVAIHDLCHDNCTPCWVGAMPQSAIGGRIGFALATKDNCTYPADFFASDRVLAADIAEPLLPQRDPADGRQRVRLSSAAGIGVEPDRVALDKYCIGHARIVSS